MKRLIFIVLAGICAVTGIFALKKLPAETDDLIEKKYDSWAGVIRVWVDEGCGAEGWLNQCASIAEKGLNGVYINIQPVPPEAISAYSQTGINPPDMIVYKGNTPMDTSGLLTVTRAYPIRAGLLSGVHSVPLMVRPRFWIYDASIYSNLPGDMHDVRTACGADDLNALVALCTGLRTSEGSPVVLPGIDLGLEGDVAAPAAPEGNVRCRVSSEIQICDSPEKLYIDGEADAFVGDISDALKLVDTRNTAAAITGDYACGDTIIVSIIEKGDGRESACMEFLNVLMSEGQASVSRARAFPAIPGASAWMGDMLLGPVEAALEELLWLADAPVNESIAHEYIGGNITADEAVERIWSVQRR